MSDNQWLFSVNPSSGEPIYRQIMGQIKRLIASGQLHQGEALPSVRQLAGELDINPMTISKAYGLLEAQELIERVRGIGMRVKSSTSQMPLQQRLQLLTPIAEQLSALCGQLDIEQHQAIQWLTEQLKKDVS
ncbi:GntR family transcriptional regulator [Lacimicrobium alkaliphilum]|nr:GntR family transcriptional regulator [Lacimicrobium alkaliphilum]